MDDLNSGSALVEGENQIQNGMGPLDLSKVKGIQELKVRLNQLDILYPNGLSYEPRPFSGQTETHIDIGNLVEDDKGKRERANFFVCPICAMVVNNPVECNSCQSVFCTECITPWRANNASCPKKCQGSNAVEFKDLHRYVKQDLQSLIFKCGMQGCGFQGPYEEAKAHYSQCEHQFIQCTQGCGMGILGKDMEYHCLKQCKLLKVVCPNCEEEFYPNDQERGGAGLENHDCVAILKMKLKEAREEIACLRGGGAMAGFAAGGGDVGVIRCPDGCQMQKIQGMPPGYEGNPRCDGCHAESLNIYPFFFHCNVHEYDLCKMCAYKSCNKFRVDVNGKFIIRGHGCPMTFNPSTHRHLGQHYCNGAQLLGPMGRCQASINYNLANKNEQFVYCDECNIDVCSCCMEMLQY